LEFVAAEILSNTCSLYSKALFPEQETSEILGSSSDAAENSSFLGCDTVSIGKTLQTFRWAIVSVEAVRYQRTQHNITHHLALTKPCVQFMYVLFVFQGPRLKPHTGWKNAFNYICKSFNEIVRKFGFSAMVTPDEVCCI
jgi:hypothetical protein